MFDEPIKFCKVTRVGGHTVTGRTQDDEIVKMSKFYGHMQHAQLGDIVVFHPCPVPPKWAGEPVRFFAKNPRIIARAFDPQENTPPHAPGSAEVTEENWAAQI